MFPPPKKTSPRSHPVVHPQQTTNKQNKTKQTKHQFTAWWWFQPIWKALVRLDHFPKGEHFFFWNHHLKRGYISFNEVMSVSAASGIHGHGPFGICGKDKAEQVVATEWFMAPNMSVYDIPTESLKKVLKNGGWKTILSYWVSVTFQGLVIVECWMFVSCFLQVSWKNTLWHFSWL